MSNKGYTINDLDIISSYFSDIEIEKIYLTHYLDGEKSE